MGRLPLLVALLLAGCATSPLGREQLKFMPDAEVSRLGAAEFSKLEQEQPQVQDPRVRAYVACVAGQLTGALGGRGPRRWELAVFKNQEPNAFALPGGEIGVYSGLLKVARNEDQLAAVLGHEIGHVIAGHPNERVSTAYAAQAGVDIAGALAGGASGGSSLASLLGVGAQVGVILPFERTQESEADLLGLELSSRAGFDPRQVIPFWQAMEHVAGGGPPEFLSTHPSGESRIRELERWMPKATELYQEARAHGHRPHCG